MSVEQLDELIEKRYDRDISAAERIRCGLAGRPAIPRRTPSGSPGTGAEGD
jgi:hypothetical protein